MDTTVIILIVALIGAVLAAVAALLAARAQAAAAEQRAQAERLLSALDEANAALTALGTGVTQARDDLGGIARRQAAESAASQQRHEAALHQAAQVADRTDSLRRETEGSLAASRDALNAQLTEMRGVVDTKLAGTLARQSSELRDQLGKFDERFSGFQTQIQGFQDQVTQGLKASSDAATKSLEEVQQTVERQLTTIRNDNAAQLDRMRETVDEKLSKTLNERLSTSFKQVSDSLEVVSQGLGEMRTVASGVGDLKRVLSNVKTRGILGEVQLGAILREILSVDQYLEDVATVPESSERVEFAVKLPVEGGDPILLPIDSKFPGDAYEHLRQALDEGDAEAASSARKVLERQIRAEAKDISEKYLSVPATTSFGIMFLPFEGLYAEVVNMPGLVELLQRDYRVNVAGPSTMAAILNSLQMSYQTFAFQKRADEIQKVLSAVKAEFPKYQKELGRALKQLQTAEKTVNGIINTRTNMMERKLKSVVALDDPAEAAALLGFNDAPEVEFESDEDVDDAFDAESEE
ncbi:DNA recombination protein RmuC [Collinsella vaginalis]|uniref:DNA recombination protein RmuC n=1 Tax=Collinsella vaginalis TaxID=1870987 RepID=UPI000A26EE3D|nr:DNA recombination protein RmuC [Collinsella vaginalis]